jgi:hypothetical protein
LETLWPKGERGAGARVSQGRDKAVLPDLRAADDLAALLDLVTARAEFGETTVRDTADRVELVMRMPAPVRKHLEDPLIL